MTEQIKSVRDLLVWQEAMQLAEGVYRMVATLPASERYELSAQLRRAAVSIPSNIAEGNGRGPSLAYVHFLKIARGSLREIETQLLLAAQLGMIGEEQSSVLLAKCDRVGRLLHGLLQSLERMGFPERLQSGP
jgi:four helix bundle protein